MAEQPTTSELILLRAFWRHGAMSARELHEATSAETNWSYSSTRKTLERMTAKGLVAVESVHRLKVYHARRSKLPTLAGLIAQFGANVLQTRETLPAAAFAQSALIDADEIDDLQALLDALATRAGEGEG